MNNSPSFLAGRETELFVVVILRLYLGKHLFKPLNCSSNCIFNFFLNNFRIFYYFISFSTIFSWKILEFSVIPSFRLDIFSDIFSFKILKFSNISFFKPLLFQTFLLSNLKSQSSNNIVFIENKRFWIMASLLKLLH